MLISYDYLISVLNVGFCKNTTILNIKNEYIYNFKYIFKYKFIASLIRKR